jgi:hypothetical protein
VLLFSYRTSLSGPSATPSTVDGQGTTVVNGSVAPTRWGPVQVQVRISAGRIVDGATVTSDGYRRSLQAALDAARFGG